MLNICTLFLSSKSVSFGDKNKTLEKCSTNMLVDAKIPVASLCVKPTAIGSHDLCVQTKDSQG